jgi:hypothetical protein
MRQSRERQRERDRERERQKGEEGDLMDFAHESIDSTVRDKSHRDVI